MKTLLYKDFCALSSTFKFVIVFLVLFGLGFGSFSVGFMAAYCSILATTALNLDEACHWNRYAVILPVSRKTLVLEKYLLMLVCTLTGVSLALLRLLLGLAIPPLHMDFTAGIISIAAAGCVGIFMNSISIPITLKFDNSKGRIFLIALFAVVMGSVAVISNSGSTQPVDLDAFLSVLGLLPYIGIALTVAVLIISYLISVHIFEKKEF